VMVVSLNSFVVFRRSSGRRACRQRFLALSGIPWEANGESRIGALLNRYKVSQGSESSSPTLSTEFLLSQLPRKNLAVISRPSDLIALIGANISGGDEDTDGEMATVPIQSPCSPIRIQVTFQVSCSSYICVWCQFSRAVSLDLCS
jgi:hypothetical protein